MTRSSEFFPLDREINRTLRQIKRTKILNQTSIASAIEHSSSGEFDTKPVSGDILDNHSVMEHVNIGEAHIHN